MPEDEQVTVIPSYRPATGRELYEAYMNLNAQQGIDLSHWHDIGEQGRRAWDCLAETVEFVEYLG